MMMEIGYNTFCFNCRKTLTFCEELAQAIDDFEVTTEEFDADPKAKSFASISNMRQIILNFLSENGKPEIDVEIPSWPNSEIGSQPVDTTSLMASDDTFFQPESPQPFICQEKVQGNENWRSEPREKVRGQKKSTKRFRPLFSTRQTEENENIDKWILIIKPFTGEDCRNFYECQICAKQFKTRGNARRHIRILHEGQGTPCPTCRRKFFDSQSLRLHILSCWKKPNITRNKEEDKKKLAEDGSYHKNYLSQPRPFTGVKSIKKVVSSLSEPVQLENFKLAVPPGIGDFDLKKVMGVQVLIDPIDVQQEGRKLSSSIKTTAEDSKEEKEEEGEIHPNSNPNPATPSQQMGSENDNNEADNPSSALVIAEIPSDCELSLAAEN